MALSVPWNDGDIANVVTQRSEVDLSVTGGSTVPRALDSHFPAEADRPGLFSFQSNVRSLRLHVSPKQFDLTKPVIVRIDGKEVARKADGWSAQTLLEGFATDADTGRLFVGSIRVELPPPAEEPK